MLGFLLINVNKSGPDGAKSLSEPMVTRVNRDFTENVQDMLTKVCI